MGVWEGDSVGGKERGSVGGIGERGREGGTQCGRDGRGREREGA